MGRRQFELELWVLKRKISKSIEQQCADDIFCKREETEHTEGKQFTRKEYSYLSFCRSFTIPESANKEKIEANYEQGILKVIIPKREESKPKPLREIKIK